MNPNIRIKRIFSSFGSERRTPNLKIQFKYKKNSLNKLLKDINAIKREIFDNKSNNIFNYNFNNFLPKPKTAVRRYNYFLNEFSPENEINLIKENKKEDNKEKDKTLKWNYSYYPTNYKNVLKKSKSHNKERIINIFKAKDPYVFDEWQKPRMIKILEKNSMIEQAVVSKPWRFFPYLENFH